MESAFARGVPTQIWNAPGMPIKHTPQRRPVLVMGKRDQLVIKLWNRHVGESPSPRWEDYLPPRLLRSWLILQHRLRILGHHLQHMANQQQLFTEFHLGHIKGHPTTPCRSMTIRARARILTTWTSRLGSRQLETRGGAPFKGQ